VLITQTNVQRTDANGGGKIIKPLLEQPCTTIIIIGGLDALDRAIETLQRLKRHHQMHDTSNDESDDPIIIDRNTTSITNQKQLDKSRDKRNRKKARIVSAGETNQQIG
jgi:hypothetical protein